MPSVVLLFALITLIGFAALILMLNQAAMTDRFTRSVNALHYAEAGLHEYLWGLNKGRDPQSGENEILELDHAERNLHYSFALVEEPTPSTVRVRVTGWAEDDEPSRRTVEALLQKRSFTNYVYFSDNDGENIWWMGEEKCYGPLHTNTVLNINETPTFYSRVTYGVGLVKGDKYNPTFAYYEGYEPQKVEQIIFPQTNRELKIITQTRYSDHFYTGRTSILLKGNVYDVYYWDESSGNFVLETDKLLPENGVIYVAGNVGTGYSTPDKFGNNMGNAFVSGTFSGRLTIAAENNIYITGRDPTEFTYHRASTTGGIKYAGTDFDLDLVTGKVTVTGSGDDMLGLIANHYIYILCWGWFDDHSRSGRPDVVPDGDITIHGAVFAINKGFGYEPYYMNKDGDYINTSSQPIWHTNHEGKGKIKLRGALIQNTRKPVGISTTPYRGYDKEYAHDPRMMYDAPPHFLEPENAGWEIVEWREIAPAAIE
jgi:hypothetical protein